MVIGLIGIVDGSMRRLFAPHFFSCRDGFKASFILTAIIVALFWSFFFQGKIIAPTDMLLDYAPWKSLAPADYVVSNPLRSDVVDQILPAWKYFQDQIHQGIVPLWNPMMAQGQPFLPLLHFSLLFPPVTILLLLLPLPLAFSLLTVLKVFAMGFFTYLFLRKLKLSFWPSISGGVVYMLCGFNVVWLFWPHTLVTAIAPLLFLATENLLQKPTLKNSAKISAVVALLIFAGFPAVAGYFFYVVWLYALLRAWMLDRQHAHEGMKDMLLVKELSQKTYGGVCYQGPGGGSVNPKPSQLRRGRFLKPLVLLVLGFVLGVMLCAIQLIPTLEYFRFIDITYRSEQSLNALIFPHVIQLILPNFYGNPAFHNWVGELNYNETTGYIGLVPLFFVLVSLIYGIVKKKFLPFFFSLLAFLSLAVVFNIGPFLYLLHFLPVFNNSSNTRLLALFGFCGATATAFGFEYTLLWLKKNLKSFFLGENFFAMLFFFFVLIDLFIFALPQNPPTDTAFFYSTTPAIEFLQQHQKPYERLMAFDYAFMIPGTQLYYGLNSVFSHTFYSEAHRELLQKFSQPFVTPTAAVPSIATTQFPSPTIQNFGVKYLVFNPSQSASLDHLKNIGYKFVYKGPDALIMQTAPRTTTQINSQILISSYQPNQLIYQMNTPQPFFLVTHELFYPGWKAFIDEKETVLYKTQKIFRGVFVPAGKHIIHFEYSPKSLWIGFAVSLFSLVLLIAIVLISKRNQKFIY